MDEDKIIIGGLKELEKDIRDFSHSTVFGALKESELPTGTFYISTPLEIKNQTNSDFCTAYAACAVSEDQEMIELNPEYSMMKSKVISGDPEAWGQDLRTACKTAVTFGFLEQQYFPYKNNPQDRDAYVNSANWHEDLDGLAYEHRKTSFFSVDGPYDTFDNFRMTLWQNKEEQRSILTGAFWKPEWTSAPKGIIPKKELGRIGMAHAFKIFGQTVIDDEIYLMAQLSNGVDIGDKGIFYFPREVVNREFIYGAFTFKDMPKEIAKYYSWNSINIDDKLYIKAYKVFRNIISNYIHI
jgi:hypothetical protein